MSNFRWAAVAVGTLLAIGLIAYATVGAQGTITEYPDFAARTSLTGQRSVDTVDGLMDAVANADLEGMIEGSANFRDVWADEVTWLAAHRPQPCYAHAHAAYLSAAEETHAAAKLISDGVANNDTDDIVEGYARLPGANDAFDEALSAVERSDCGE